jgi:hypothetical protein
MLKIILLIVIISLLFKFREGNQSSDNKLIAFFDNKQNDEAKQIKYKIQNINNAKLLPSI